MPRRDGPRSTQHGDLTVAALWDQEAHTVGLGAISISGDRGEATRRSIWRRPVRPRAPLFPSELLKSGLAKITPSES